MRWRWLIIASLALNVVLAAIWIRHGRRPEASPPVADAPSTPPTNPPSRVIVRQEFFNWQQVESPDFRLYISNLTAIGCPPQTIRHIIVGEVDQLYARKRVDEIAAADQEWWKYDPGEHLPEATRAKLRALDLDQRNVLAALLGPDWDKDNPTNATQVIALNGAVLGALSPETKQAVHAIVSRSGQRVQALLDSRRTNNVAVSQTDLVKLQQETRSELALVLKPNELEEFLLRYSQTATDLRAQFRKFDLSPDEFRNLFRGCDALDQEIAGYDASNPLNANVIAALEQKMNAAIQTALGSARYQAYFVATDPVYAQALAMAQEADAPGTALDLYNLLESARDQQATVLTSTNLSNAQKIQQMREIINSELLAQYQILGITPNSISTANAPLPSGLGEGQIHPYFPGESLDQISTVYHVPAYDILMANPNVNFNALRSGQPIFIPGK